MNNQLEKALSTIKGSLLLKLYLVLVIIDPLILSLGYIYSENVIANNPGVDPDLLLEFNPYLLSAALPVLLALAISLYVLIAVIDRKIPIIMLLVPLAEFVRIVLGVLFAVANLEGVLVIRILSFVITIAPAVFAALLGLALFAYKPIQKSDTETAMQGESSD